jgi:pimeloyl-ACP methyl ester carboxylesterase
MERSEVTLHGHRFTYRSAGSGPLLVLLHGIAGSSETWEDVIPRLASRYTVIAPDLLGHGDSSKPRGDYSLGAYSNAIRDLFGALGHDRGTVVGHSLGGGIAMQFAYQFPERCERLVLVSSGGLGPEVHALLRAAALPGAGTVLPWLCVAGRRSIDGLRPVFGRLGLRAGTDLEEIWRNFASLEDPDARQAFIDTVRGIIDLGGQRVSATDRLYLAAELPTLIIWGEKDPLIPVRHAREAHERVPGSRLEIFPGTGHFPYRDDPGRFAAVVLDFVQSTQATPIDENRWRTRLRAGAPSIAGVPDGVRTLLDRFDASAFDAPEGRARIRLVIPGEGQWDAVIDADRVRLTPPHPESIPDATLTADASTWDRIAADLRGGMDAYRAGRLVIRHNLHLGVGLLAATSGARGPERLRFERIATDSGELSVLAAGAGEPVLLLHGLGATKGSFLPTVAALADSFRLIAVDLPGFGDSVKPLRAGYHAPFFARSVIDLMDALGLRRAHVIGNSMGGRVALEIGLRHPERVGRLTLLAPSLAWRRGRPWAPFVRVLRPELGLLQITPRRVVEAVVRRMVPAADSSWVQAGVDEFLRAYLTPRGRMAFYAAARQIYLEEPHGAKGFWTRLAKLGPEALFIWGKRDGLVPVALAAHVRDALPSAHHLELDCGHVPQLERPTEAHHAIASFLKERMDR